MTTLPQTTSIQLPRPASVGAITPVPVAPAMGLGAPVAMTGSDVWRVIRTNILLIGVSVVASIVIGFGLNWYLSAYFSRYTATGYVQIQTKQRIYNDDNRPDDQESLVVEQRTHSQLLQTDSLFTKVLQNGNAAIRKTEWFNQFKNADGTPDVAAAKYDLTKHFSAVPVSDSKLIAVSMEYRKPQDCRTVVLDIVGQHIDEQRKISSQNLIDRANYLGNLRTQYENRLTSLKRDNARDAASLQLDGFGRPGGVGQKEQELSILISQRIKAESEASAAKAMLEGTEQEMKTGNIPAAVEAIVEQNPMVMQRRMEVDSAEINLRSVQNQGANSRAVMQLTALRDATQQLLDEIRSEQRTTQTVAYLAQLQSKASASQHDLEEITKQISRVTDNLGDMAGKLSDYLTRKDEEAGVQEMVRRVRDQIDALNQAIAQLDMNTIGWSAQPETPDTPSFPKLPVTLAACMALGLGLSLGIAFLREAMDTTVRSPRDIARVGQMNLLGMIPHEDDDPQAEGVPLATVIYGAPTSMLAEQFRQVRTRLQHAASLDTTRSILVTSPSPGDGKSTVAANLAAGLALNGRRILLVDANFRRPDLHKIFGFGNELGFGSVLNSIENFETAVHQTKVPNLDLMTTGAKPANATELLESQLLIDFIERALEEYDHVIFDSGPMLFVSETVALAPRVDGVVTVVRAATNSRGLLQRMRDGLRQLKAEHLGVVLNGVRATGGGYYGRNIKTYYEYQNGHNA